LLVGDLSLGIQHGLGGVGEDEPAGDYEAAKTMVSWASIEAVSWRRSGGRGDRSWTSGTT
ncbi:MAG TPA: hypothetical protein DEH05_03995, partial [Propionibacteriaceae bacterium]|nr:hypothetical protein [Propionibacteriaceae bacterium]